MVPNLREDGSKFSMTAKALKTSMLSAAGLVGFVLRINATQKEVMQFMPDALQWSYLAHKMPVQMLQGLPVDTALEWCGRCFALPASLCGFISTATQTKPLPPPATVLLPPVPLG